MAIIEENIIDQTQSTIEEVQAGQTLGPTEMATGPEPRPVYMANLLKLINIPKKTTQKVVSDVEPSLIKDVEQKVFKEGETVESIQPEELIETPAVGDPGFNFNYINNIDDVADVISTTSSKIEQPTSLSFAETKNLAKDLDMDPEILESTFQKGVLFKQGVPLAAQMKAVRDTLVTSAEKLNTMSKQIVDNKTKGITDAQLLVDFRKQLTLHAAIQSYAKGAQFEIAQALNSFKIPADASVDKGTLLNNIVSDMGGSKNTEELAEKYLKTFEEKGMGGVNKFVAKSWGARTKEALEEAYIAGLLFNPRTQLRNVIGSTLYVATSIPRDIIAGAVGYTQRTGSNLFRKYLFKGKGDFYASSDGVFMGEAIARAQGYITSLADAWTMASKAFKDSAPSDASLRVETYKQPKISAEAFGLNGTSGKFVDYLGKVTRFSFDAMLFGDEFIKEVARSGEQYAQAYRAMKKAEIEGKSAEEIMQIATDIINDRTLVQMEVDQVAKHFTLQDELGTAGKKIQAFQTLPGARYILPFVKTPTNIMKIIYRASGFGLIDPAIYKDPVKFQQTAAQVGLAYTFGGYMLSLAQQGQITGKAPVNKKDRDALYALGWKPYSFVFADPELPEGSPLFDENGIPTGNHTYVTYSGYEPVGAIIGIAANTFELMSRSRDPEINDNVVQAFALSTFDYFKQLPVLQGVASISDIVGSLYNQEEAINADKAFSIVSNAFLPFSSGVRTIESLVDPELRETDPDFNIDMRELVPNEQGVLVPNPLFGAPKESGLLLSLIKTRNDFLDKLPGSENFFDLPPKIDIFGEDIVVNENINTWGNMFNMVSPSTFSKGKNIGPEAYEILRLGNPIQNPGRKKGGIKLTPSQYYYWVKVAKSGTTNKNGIVEQVRIKGMNFMEYINYMMYSPQYIRANENKQYDLLRGVQNDFLTAAWEDHFQYEYPDVYDAVDIKKTMIEEGEIKKPGR